MKKAWPVDTGRKLNVHKAFRRRPGFNRFLIVFNRSNQSLTIRAKLFRKSIVRKSDRKKEKVFRTLPHMMEVLGFSLQAFLQNIPMFRKVLNTSLSCILKLTWQWRIQITVKHLRWSFFAKIVNDVQLSQLDKCSATYTLIFLYSFYKFSNNYSSKRSSYFSKVAINPIQDGGGRG